MTTLRQIKLKWVVPEKNPQNPMDGILEFLMGQGSKTLEIQVRGGLNLLKSSAGVISTDS